MSIHRYIYIHSNETRRCTKIILALMKLNITVTKDHTHVTEPDSTDTQTTLLIFNGLIDRLNILATPTNTPHTYNTYDN